MSEEAFNLQVAQCGGCGAPVEFKVGSSRVAVCQYCHYVVARTDRGFENLGKVADLVPTGARLTLGAEGSYDGSGFRLVGRTQLSWKQGVWDEWYAAFDDGRWGWVAEAGGRYFVSFEAEARHVPPFPSLRPGQSLFLARLGRFVVADLKQATYVSAQGELPVAFPIDGSPVKSADLSGQGGAFATLDYGSADDHPTLYLGREVTLDDLRIRTEQLPPAEKKKLSSATLTCPSCKAPVAPRMPNEALRVTCDHCNSLLDASEGTLKFLQALKPPKELLFPLGSRCNFFGTEYLLVGWMRRSCTVEGERYPWDEYLLYDEKTSGFRFLLVQNGHWSFVEPIAPGDVEQGPAGANYQANFFRMFSVVEAQVERVYGEFYWAVEVGETVAATDFIRVPEGLSKESGNGEVTWSHAVYVEPEDVYRAFGKKDEPPPRTGIGAIQPWPYEQTFSSMLSWLGFGLAAGFVLLIAFIALADEKVVYDANVQASALNGSVEEGEPAAARQPNTDVVYSPAFEVASGHRNLMVELTSDVSQTWVWVGASLVNERTGEVTEFALENSYYSGTDSDGSWSEGSRSADTFIGDVDPGKYVLRMETQWENGKPRPTAHIRLTSGVARLMHFLLLLGALIVPPIFLGWRRGVFEQTRWEDSNV